MKSGFFLKLAWSNLKKNNRFFIPRILSEIGLQACFYIAITLAMDERISQIRGGSYIPTFMWIGVAVLTVLSIVLMFYTNSFLMKQRQREFGLYNVLGLEKKHVWKVLFCESLISSLISVVLGLSCGVLFYKICSLLICRFLEADILLGFYFFNLKTVLSAGAFFVVLDFIICIFNRIIIARMKPVELLASRHTGEKEPKVKWVLFVLGLAALGGGYYISLTTLNPVQALLNFFIAVMLVIIGTYFLFVSGTIFVLKALKNSKKFYYSKRHMPAVSGLLYRMKQNAVGLASIAILATGVLVMVSTTSSLYAGLDETLEKNYPMDMYVSSVYETEGHPAQSVPAEKLEEFVLSAAEKNHLTVEKIEKNSFLFVTYFMNSNTLYTLEEVMDDFSDYELYKGIANFLFISNETYEELTGAKLNLTGNEIATCRISSDSDNIADLTGNLRVHGKTYSVQQTLVSYPIKSSEAIMNGFTAYGIVFANEEILNEFYQLQCEANLFASEMTDRIGVSFADRSKAGDCWRDLYKDIQDSLSAYLREQDQLNGYSSNINAVWEAKESLIGMYGSLLFLGILLGAVSMFATVLIIYYKQISEGYEDRERFQIMEKIGMSRKEVRKTISFQVLLVFFLPLVTAGVHMAFAYPMLQRMLTVLAFCKPHLFLFASLITFAVFAIVYILIYIGTSKTYYKIVH